MPRTLPRAYSVEAAFLSNLKTSGDKSPTRRRNKPLADMWASGSLLKPPVSLSPGDEVLHMFTRKPRLQLEKLAINGAKKTFATKSAISGLMQCSKNPYSITSSARASRVGGISSPSALAVATLITSSNLTGNSIGNSAGLSPLSILSTKYAARR
jgi:hypothetical protein